MGPILNHFRYAVIRTRRIPGLRWVYGKMYSFALSMICRHLSKNPDIVCVLLRCAHTGPDWQAGLSDIDLTVLYRDREISSQGSLDFLERFWPQYSKIRKWIPVTGEVEVLGVNAFCSSLACACSPTYSLKTHRIVFHRLTEKERQALECCLADSRESVRDEMHVRNVLTRYNHVSLPHFFGRTVSYPHVSTLLLSHSIKKLHQILDQVSCSADGSGGCDLVRVVQRMSDYCREHVLSCGENNFSSGKRKVDTWIQGGKKAGVPEKVLDGVAAFSRTIHLGICSIVVWPASGNSGKFTLAFVFEDAASKADADELFQAVRNFFYDTWDDWESTFINDPHQWTYPVAHPLVLTRSLFTCWLHLNPLEKLALQADRQCFGEDLSFMDSAISHRSVAEFAAVQYGVWLVNRNQWLRQGERQSRVLFYDLMDKVGKLLRLLSPGGMQLPAGGYGNEEAGESLESLYDQSSRALQMLGDAIQSRDE